MLATFLKGASAAAADVEFVSSSINRSNQATNTVTAPAGIQDGDLLVAYGSILNINRTVTLPSGFTSRLLVQNTANGNMTVFIATKAASNESGNYVFTWNQTRDNTVSILVYRNAADEGRFIGAETGGTSASATATSITPAVKGALLALFSNVDTRTVLTPPSGMTQLALHTGSAPPVAAYGVTPNGTDATGDKTLEWSGSSRTSSVQMQIYAKNQVIPPRVTLHSSDFQILAASTNLTLNWGADVDAGDVLVVAFGSSSTGTNFSAPSGWTRILLQTNTDNDSVAVHAIRLASGGAGSVTFASSTLGSKTVAFTIWRGAQSNATAAGSSNNAASTDILAPSVSVSTAGAAVMPVFFMDDASSGLTITVPSGVTALGALQNSGNSRYMQSGYVLDNPVGATGTFTATASQSHDSVGATVLIQ
jgi:hypothetical protein